VCLTQSYLLYDRRRQYLPLKLDSDSDFWKKPGI
jgi:hypothetical protein